jgi:putative ABC transport system permease protein
LFDAPSLYEEARPMSAIIADVRYACRMMRRAPGLTLAAILSLALGIGANATIFSWVRAFLLEPFPGVAAQRDLIVLSGTNPAGETISVSYPDYRDFRDRSSTLSALVAQDLNFASLAAAGTGTSGPAAGEPAQRIMTLVVSGNYFGVLGVQAQRGRVFTPDDDRVPNGHPVLVISHALWQRRFGGRADIVGAQVSLNSHPFTVIGITPEPFVGSIGGLAADAWVPMMMVSAVDPGADRLEARGTRWMQCLARLKPGATMPQAQAELETIARNLAVTYPRSNEGQGVRLLPLTQAPWGSQFIMRPVLVILSAMVGLILTIACVNVANLLLGRALGRQREIAIRLAIGAGRRRLVRQLLTESVVLALAAGVAGIGVAAFCVNLLAWWMPPTDVPIRAGVGLDSSLMLFAIVLAAIVGILFGLAPAWRLARTSLVDTLKEDAGSTLSASRSRVRAALVVVQVMLSLVLLVIAGLFLRSLRVAQNMSPGFNPAHVVIATYDLFPNGYTNENGLTFHTQLVDRVAALPGVRAAGLASFVPLGLGGTSTWRMRVDGYVPAPGESMDILRNVVTPDYFRAMEIPLVSGRTFTTGDRAGALRVIVINETMAKRYWQGQDPIGRTVRTNDTAFEVIGVVRSGKYRSLGEAPRPAAYFPLAQSYRPEMTLHVRTTGDPAAIVQAIRDTTSGLDANVPLFDVRTMTAYMGFATFPERIAGSFLGASGTLALLLAGIGLYSVMAYMVAQRRRELAIRMALGARPEDMRRMVVRHALTLVAIGLVLGTVAVWPLTRVLARSGLLVGVTATDPLTLALVMIVLAVVAFAASVVPALRASRIDPIVALKG